MRRIGTRQTSYGGACHSHSDLCVSVPAHFYSLLPLRSFSVSVKTAASVRGALLPASVVVFPESRLYQQPHTRMAIICFLHTRMAIICFLHTWMAIICFLHTRMAIMRFLHTRM